MQYVSLLGNGTEERDFKGRDNQTRVFQTKGKIIWKRCI